MRKKVGIIKRVSCIGLIFLLSINSFAAIVSDNDGSAFITKAEFDSLKNSFQSQIDSYNQSIDSKIDGAIASYLAGIKLSTETTMDTFCGTYGYIRSFDDDNDLPWIEPTWGFNWSTHLYSYPNVESWTPIYSTLSWNTRDAGGGLTSGYKPANQTCSLKLRSSSDPFAKWSSYVLWRIEKNISNSDYGKVRLVTRTDKASVTSECTAQWLGYYTRNVQVTGYQMSLQTSDYTTNGFWTIGLDALPLVRDPLSTLVGVGTVVDFINNDYVVTATGAWSKSLWEDHVYIKTSSYRNYSGFRIKDLAPFGDYVSDKLILAFNGDSAIGRLTTNEGRYFNNDTKRDGHSFVTSITRDWWGKSVDQSLKLAHKNQEFKNDSGYETGWYDLHGTIYGGGNYFCELEPPSGYTYGNNIKKWSDFPASYDTTVMRHTKPYEGFVENVTKQGSLYTMEFDAIADTAPSTAVKYDNYVPSVWDTNKTKTTNPHLSIAAGIPVVKVKKNNTYKIKVEAQSASPQIYFWLAKNAFAASGNPDADTNAVNLQTENPSLTAAGNKGVRLNMSQATSATGCIITYTATEDGYLYAKWGKSTTEAGGSVRMTEVVEVNNNA